MPFFKGGTIVDAARSRYLGRKLAVVGGGLMVFLLCNYVALIGRLSMISDSVHDVMTSIDSSFGRSSRIGTNYYSNSTSTWKKILRNQTSSSRIGIHALRSDTPATNIIVLGERHSGTTFFTKYLSDCFPNTKIRDTFVNNKHWIQQDPEYVFQMVSSESSSIPSLWRDIAKPNNGTFGKYPQRQQSPDNYFQNSLVLVLFRNPYHWVEAMRRKPWHWPNHVSLFPLSAKNVTLDIKAQNRESGAGASGGGYSVQKSYVGHDLLDWKDFVDRPLYLKDDDDEGETSYGTNESTVCQKGYARNTVSPCRANPNYVPKPLRSIPKAFLHHLPFDTHNPFYEHNPIDGRPFENLLQLRAFKVRNFLSLPERWELAGIGFLPYDRLLGDGLKSLTEEIATTLGILDACPSIAHFEKAPYNLTDEFREWITKAVDWDVERLIGYQRSAP